MTSAIATTTRMRMRRPRRGRGMTTAIVRLAASSFAFASVASSAPSSPSFARRRRPSLGLRPSMVPPNAGVVEASSTTGRESHRHRRRRGRDDVLDSVCRGGGGGILWASSGTSTTAAATRGGRENADIVAEVEGDGAAVKSHAIVNALYATSFLMASSLSMVMFAPLPTLTRYLQGIADSSMSLSSSAHPPQARAIRILSTLSALSAAFELLLSPFIGSIIDEYGRKYPAAILSSMVSLSNLYATMNPNAFGVCLSRTINVLGGGFAVIITNAIVADLYGGTSVSGGGSDGGGGGDGVRMGSVLGAQAAYASLGFLLGSMIGGRLTDVDVRCAYGGCSLLSALATANVALRMPESLDIATTRDGEGRGRGGIDPSRVDECEHDDDASDPRTKFVEAPLSSVRLLYRYGSRMRTLSALLLLQSIPMYMGDVFQLFAREEWGLRPREFANLVALFGILGIVSNVSVPLVLKSIGLRSFSLLATSSSLFFPLTTLLTDSYRSVVYAGCIGMLGNAQKLGTNAAMASLATELGVQQGRLQGEKASMLALLKILSPIVYGMLYLRGKAWSAAGDDSATGGVGDGSKVWSDVAMGKIGRKLPFALNVLLGLCAFAVTWKNL